MIPDIAAKSRIFASDIPILNGSKRANEHFSGTFWQPDSHYTLSEADLAASRRCRGDHNRLGHALMLCYLRFQGRALRAGERPPPALLEFVAAQVDVLPDASTNI